MKMKSNKNKGWILTEAMIGVAIATGLLVAGLASYKFYSDMQLSKNVGDHLKQVGLAANAYTSTNYSKIVQGLSEGGRNCSGNGCTITVKELMDQGFLPRDYSGKNPVKLEYEIKVIKEGNAPDWILNGVVVTKKPWMKKQNVAYDMIGKAVEEAGIDAGMVGINHAGKLNGYAAGWSIPLSTYNIKAEKGLLGYRFGHQSAMMNQFLRRDGTLPMTGNLNMGGNTIHNTSEISGVNNELILNSNATVKGTLKSEGQLEVDAGIIAKGVIESDSNLCGHRTAIKGVPSRFCIGSDSTGSNTFKDAFNFTIEGTNIPLVIRNAGKNVNLIVEGSSKATKHIITGKDNIDQFDNAKLDEMVNRLSVGQSEGAVVSNLNISNGIVVKRASRTAQEVLNYNPNDYQKENSPVAIELKNDGTLVVDDIYVRRLGNHMSEFAASYVSRGARVVSDGDIMMKPKCVNEKTGKKAIPKVILSWGNLQSYGNEMRQEANGRLVRSPMHRVTLIAEELGGDKWKAIIQTKDWNGNPIPAGQAIAHFYCQMYN